MTAPTGVSELQPHVRGHYAVWQQAGTLTAIVVLLLTMPGASTAPSTRQLRWARAG